MRLIAHSIKTAIFTFTVISGAFLAAQTTSPCGVAVMGVGVYPSYAKTSPTFSATIQTTHDQKLADGNAIHGSIVTHFYRDSTGRTRNESSGLCSFGLDGKLRPTINVTVNDPAKHTVLSWRINGQDKIAHLVHQEERPQSLATPPTPEQRALNAIIQQHWRQNTRSEKLPDRNIAGVWCEDSRQITTTPTGEQGNQRPLEMATEVCIAQDVGLTMLRITDDSFNGRTETEVTDFSSGEPDPSVFAPPQDYTIQEQQLKTVSVVSLE
jgi:hypothetical protein